MPSHSKADNSQTDPALVKLFKEALACQSRGDKNSAVIAWKRIHRQFPDFADAWTNASTLLNEMERAEEALDMALRAVELDPENPLAIYALANAHLNLKHLDEGAVYLRNVIERDPKHFPSLAKLAEILTLKCNLIESIELYDRAIHLMPSLSILWEYRGYAKLLVSNMAGAEADFIQAIKLEPYNERVQIKFIDVLMLQYRYREVWQLLKGKGLDRWSVMGEKFERPRWKGEPLNGRTLLVYTKLHGFGDTIQFVRFLPQIQRQYDGRILLYTYEPLKRLLMNLPGFDELIIEGGQLPDFDLVATLQDLLVILNIDISDLPPPIKIFVEPDNYSPELDKPGLKVGLTWAGSPSHMSDAKRSMNPRILDDLADIPGIAWYGLQKMPSIESLESPNLPGLIDMSPHMGDFMDTARIVKRLDLIVTVDTSMAHLAGSLGLPTIVLLQNPPDWRWGLGEYTPWYQTLALLRQTAHGDWAEVISLLKQRIIKLATFGKRDAPTYSGLTFRS